MRKTRYGVKKSSSRQRCTYCHGSSTYNVAPLRLAASIFDNYLFKHVPARQPVGYHSVGNQVPAPVSEAPSLEKATGTFLVSWTTSNKKKNTLQADLAASPLWKLVAEVWICVAPNNRKVMKAEHGRQVPRKINSKPRAFNSAHNLPWCFQHRPSRLPICFRCTTSWTKNKRFLQIIKL